MYILGPKLLSQSHKRHKNNSPYRDATEGSFIVDDSDDDDVDALATASSNVPLYDNEEDSTPGVATLNGQPINLRQYAELSPITLSWESSLQLATSMFQKLGCGLFYLHKR